MISELSDENGRPHRFVSDASERRRISQLLDRDWISEFQAEMDRGLMSKVLESKELQLEVLRYDLNIMLARPGGRYHGVGGGRRIWTWREQVEIRRLPRSDIGKLQNLFLAAVPSPPVSDNAS